MKGLLEKAPAMPALKHLKFPHVIQYSKNSGKCNPAYILNFLRDSKLTVSPMKELKSRAALFADRLTLVGMEIH